MVDTIDTDLKKLDVAKPKSRNGNGRSRDLVYSYLVDLSNQEHANDEYDIKTLKKLAQGIKDGDETARSQLAVSHTKLVISIAKKYFSFANGRIGSEDIISDGNEGLMMMKRIFL